MLQSVFDLYKSCFSFGYKVFHDILVVDGISMWSIYLVAFVASGIISMIIKSFGASGITRGGSGIENSIQQRNKKIERESKYQNKKK